MKKGGKKYIKPCFTNRAKNWVYTKAMLIYNNVHLFEWKYFQYYYENIILLR